MVISDALVGADLSGGPQAMWPDKPLAPESALVKDHQGSKGPKDSRGVGTTVAWAHVLIVLHWQGEGGSAGGGPEGRGGASLLTDMSDTLEKLTEIYDVQIYGGKQKGSGGDGKTGKEKVSDTAMSSLHYDNMSPMLQRHHKIALAKKQITSIDPPPLAASCSKDAAGRKERASCDTGAAVCLT
ncbi:hypothetical protein NQZ68_020562 [Dissostichus eleginoides]|nr:hypothetical protein NQZ68_020562 [Dissostichus eleginoides]